jgi:prepilin-type N-terminal cleavage/methylation domain-containing protein
MKITTSINSRSAERRLMRAFTLIEMIGVLAVIAILASLLIPKVFNAINSSRVNNTVVSYNTIKTAVTDHYAKYGSLTSFFGTNTITEGSGYDTNVLLPETLIDKPFSARIGNGAAVCLWTTMSKVGGGSGYKLDGVNGATATMSAVCEVVITNVAAQDAFDIGTILDGANLTTAAGTQDQIGRVEYITNGVASPLLYIYVTGR